MPAASNNELSVQVCASNPSEPNAQAVSGSLFYISMMSVSADIPNIVISGV